MTPRSRPPLFSVARLTGWRPVVAVVRLGGVIGTIGPLRRGLTLAALAPLLERAFRQRRLKAVALAINSPGGSAVQSALIAGRIRALADEHKVPVIAFAEDAAASGGYWLAAAADEIYADPASVIGSIGVLSGGFGFPALLERIGVERRVRTAGAHKAALDPFRPENSEDVAHLNAFLADIHNTFCEAILERRGDRLRGDRDELFSGWWWSGRQALDLGLIDGLGNLRGVMRERYGETVRLKLISERQPWFRRPLGVGATASLAATLADGTLADGTLAAVEERLLWSRYGL